ncbi:Peptidase family M23 [Fodinibius sediminis]|uniref:Peptidase family M23 n=2 Tax=Fodinibius sediminis TaxID=1214077 RepID=A0A521E9Q1_9BACT|nr:Peptidase family M23 [Fodinibius sediminis]
MNYPDEMYLFDFTSGYNPGFVRSKRWGIGRYNEKRAGMYVAAQYCNKRNIHMGIDIWTEAGAPVFSFANGTVAYLQDNNKRGDYGPTIIIAYDLDGTQLFALYGHLSRSSLERWSAGDRVQRGQQIGALGSREENGGWVPHLHFQLSVRDPGEADMPGVVSEERREEALRLYPDPRRILGELYRQEKGPRDPRR